MMVHIHSLLRLFATVNIIIFIQFIVKSFTGFQSLLNQKEEQMLF
jgi:hypothetical protein